MCGVKSFPSVERVLGRGGACAPLFPAIPPFRLAGNLSRINVAETANASLDMTAAAVEAAPHADPEGWNALRACAFG
jgi:hypothetical protein